MTITMQTDSPADYVQGLRDVANFLESHPSLIPPYAGVDITECPRCGFEFDPKDICEDGICWPCHWTTFVQLVRG